MIEILYPFTRIVAILVIAHIISLFVELVRFKSSTAPTIWKFIRRDLSLFTEILLFTDIVIIVGCILIWGIRPILGFYFV